MITEISEVVRQDGQRHCIGWMLNANLEFSRMYQTPLDKSTKPDLATTNPCARSVNAFARPDLPEEEQLELTHLSIDALLPTWKDLHVKLVLDDESPPLLTMEETSYIDASFHDRRDSTSLMPTVGDTAKT
jgi:hypothetical protein